MIHDHFFRRIGCRGTLAVLSICFIGAAPESLRKEAIQAEYLKALPLLQQRFDHCNGEGLFTTFRIPKGSNSPTVDLNRTWVEFSFAGGRGKTVRTPLDSIKHDVGGAADEDLAKLKPGRNPGLQAVTAYNQTYSFDLLGAKPAYKVEDLKASDKSGRESLINNAGYAACSAFMAYHTPISVYFGFNDFRLDRVTALSPEMNPRLKLEFSVIPRPITKPSGYRIASGWFVVNPADEWLIHEYGIVYNWSSSAQTTNVGRVQYQTGPDGRSRPARTSYRIYRGKFTADPAATDPAVIPASGEDFQFAKFQFGDEPERDFTLSAFGLPEFGQADAGSFPWVLMVAVAGFAALAFALRRFSRREGLSPDRAAG